MLYTGIIQQKATMGWDELRTQLELLLIEDVQAGSDGQPSTSELRKATQHSGEIMKLFEAFLEGRRS